ncbi:MULTISPECIES: hypothetical protein [Psychrilyobacter]|uniref:Uncharacterized protein n=1 Tax=Psychrilyobacter piezotolerans TaxID=2293438 RepID=A0ABX9KJ07_9FUSO|nr:MULTISPECIES: hypothetical protein [Psychrilyobacter]MCS5420754.1 hypothetical protein [Psychrilyobacter sp. S5]NDI77452.1 hypothetical protein [Psychrilyobacter piezotolerans]RDE63754.1 hypothetical protein DV867_05095 [Psychrilyobacter sp. S5]REI42098.1 hypothetical protein DYH56_05095 [Psychrilyobacter piezotolerans]
MNKKIREHKLQLLEKRLNYEENRRNNLYTRLTLPITLSTLILGGFGYVFNNLYRISHILISKKNVLFFLVFILIFVSILLVALGAFYLIKSLFGYKYEYLPLPSNHIKDIDNAVNYYDHEHYKDWEKNKIKINIYEDIDNLHIKNAIFIGDINTKENDRRVTNIYKSIKNLTISGLILLIVIIFIKYEGGEMSDKENKPKPIPPKPIPSSTVSLMENYDLGTDGITFEDLSIGFETINTNLEDNNKNDK